MPRTKPPKLSRLVAFRLSPAELLELERRAKAADATVSGIIREALFADREDTQSKEGRR